MASTLVALVLVAASCGSSSPSRSDVLGELGESTIAPAYADLAAAADTLDDAISALCDDPGEATLADARDALVEVRADWTYTEAMWVGPATDRRSWGRIDWPVRTDEIDELLSDGSVELTADYVGERIGADQRGLGAIEYLLGPAGSPPPTDQRRCEYLAAVSAVASAETRALEDAWTRGHEDGPPYTEVLADPETEGVDGLVNATLFLLEAVTDMELGVALGEMDRAPDVTAIVEGTAGLGVADLDRRLAGIRAVLLGAAGDGAGGEGLGPLLGDDLTRRLVTAIDDAAAAVASIDGPLRAAVVETPGTVSGARDELKDVQVLVATEVVSRLGVTVGFSDADGDSSG